ncbi:MAG: ABC-2 family transporter protein [Bacilli bacterium]|nr:ABC-2 family transporter protein [Bacilli bacterium]
MKVYLKAISLHFKSAIEYRASFVTAFLSQIVVFFSYYFVILSLFNKFDNIKGFTLYEVLLCFAVIHFGYSFCEVFARGIDRFDKLIINGDFDRLLLRPKNVLLQVLCSDFDPIKLARFIQSLIVLVVALLNLNIEWTILKVLCLLFMLISSIVIFFSIFVISACYCFITIQGLEIRNLLMDGGKYMAQYPIGIFKKGFVIFFTVIIPYGLVNYYPLLYFTGKSNNILYMLAPIFVFLYLIPSIWLFNKGMKKYSSTGS